MSDDEKLCCVCGQPEEHRSHHNGDHRFGTRAELRASLQRAGELPAPAAGPWISVAERLPEDGQLVLIRINGDYTSGMPRRATRHRRPSVAKRTSSPSGWDTIESSDDIRVWLSDRGKEDGRTHVTHWAELHARD